MIIFIIDILLMSILILTVLRERKLYMRKLHDEAQARLNYIHILIDTVYTYGSSHELLSTRLKQEMSAKKLLLYGIVERKKTEACAPELKISEDDRLLYQLLQEGFSPRELCIIFALNNINSLYVKHHRIRKKLGLLSDTNEKIKHKDRICASENKTKAPEQECKIQQSVKDRIDENGTDAAEKEKEPAEAEV